MTDLIQQQLASQEAIIERGLASFVEVGSALEVIRVQRLYRDSHGSFEDYCRSRWGLDARQAYRKIAASTTARTYKIRMGGSSAVTVTFNGHTGGRIFGGVMSSSIHIKEIVP